MLCAQRGAPKEPWLKGGRGGEARVPERERERDRGKEWMGRGRKGEEAGQREEAVRGKEGGEKQGTGRD